MFVLTTVTRDCKNGDLYVSVDDNAYLTKEAASTALRARYEDFLKSMELEDNGASDENGNAMPGGYCISDEASIYDYADYANCQLLPIVVYWKDETAPFSFEMSTAIGDETIAATAMLGEESPDTYPSIRLDSRNARKDSSATWFILETPNETNPYVTGYAYAGNDETEGDSWITKIVDVILSISVDR